MQPSYRAHSAPTPTPRLHTQLAQMHTCQHARLPHGPPHTLTPGSRPSLPPAVRGPPGLARPLGPAVAAWGPARRVPTGDTATPGGAGATDPPPTYGTTLHKRSMDRSSPTFTTLYNNNNTITITIPITTASNARLRSQNQHSTCRNKRSVRHINQSHTHVHQPTWAHTAARLVGTHNGCTGSPHSQGPPPTTPPQQLQHNDTKGSTSTQHCMARLHPCNRNCINGLGWFACGGGANMPHLMPTKTTRTPCPQQAGFRTRRRLRRQGLTPQARCRPPRHSAASTL